jgi:hypothetical protein
MTLSQLHVALGNAATMFVAVIGVWALVLRVRSRPLDAAWYGAAVVGEALIVVLAAVGLLLYMQGMGAALPRPFMHILYGVVAVVTLPAAYAYFGHLENENVKAFAMAMICLFLWGILLRASTVAQYLPANYQP